MINDPQEFPRRWTEGDTRPVLIGVKRNTNLTGYTITLHMERRTSTLIKSATITDAANGKFQVTWSIGDLLEGNNLSEIQFIDTGAEITTSRKFILPVDKEIA